MPKTITLTLTEPEVQELLNFLATCDLFPDSWQDTRIILIRSKIREQYNGQS